LQGLFAWSVLILNIIEAYKHEKNKRAYARPSLTALAYSLPGFAERQYAKPAHAGYLQVPPTLPALTTTP